MKIVNFALIWYFDLINLLGPNFPFLFLILSFMRFYFMKEVLYFQNLNDFCQKGLLPENCQIVIYSNFFLHVWLYLFLNKKFTSYSLRGLTVKSAHPPWPTLRQLPFWTRKGMIKNLIFGVYLLILFFLLEGLKVNKN